MIIDFSDTSLFNKHFISLLQNQKRYVFLVGGAGSGKSVFQAQREIIKTFSKNKIMVIRKVGETHKYSTYAELKNIIDIRDLSKYFEFRVSPLYIKNILTGSEIIFRGLDDPEKIKSVQGINRIWIEEATELTKEDFNQLDLRLRGSNHLQMTLTCNPINKDHWINQDFWMYGNTDEIECHHSTFLNNEWIDTKYQQVFNRLKQQNPSYYGIYALGEWGILEGLVFEVQPEIVDKVEGELVCYGLDFGFSNDPTAMIGIYKYNGGILLNEFIYKTGLTNQDLMKEFERLEIDRNSAIYADSSEPKSIEEIYRSRWNIHGAKKGPDSIIYGIDMMKSYKMYVTKQSGNLIKEFNNYVWQKDKNGNSINKPIDTQNHCLDGSRYGIIMAFGQQNKLVIIST